MNEANFLEISTMWPQIASKKTNRTKIETMLLIRPTLSNWTRKWVKWIFALDKRCSACTMAALKSSQETLVATMLHIRLCCFSVSFCNNFFPRLRLRQVNNAKHYRIIWQVISALETTSNEPMQRYIMIQMFDNNFKQKLLKLYWSKLNYR